MVTLPPGLGLTPEIVRKYLDRIAWRRHMKKEQRGNFDEKYPEDPVTAFLVSGNQYFDRELVIARRLELVTFKPWKMFDNGGAKLFFQRVPGKRYVIGADVATGRTISNDNTDFQAAVVLDLETGEEYASYHARVTPQDFAFDLDDLGRYYNNATIAVERTGDGGTVILTLQGECGYGNIYRHREWTKRNKANGRIIEFEGFPTTPKTRPIALNFLQQFMVDHPDLIWDADFLQEALMFVRDERGIPAAAPGAHDDRVSARWVAHAARRALMGWWIPTESKRERYLSASQVTDAA